MLDNVVFLKPKVETYIMKNQSKNKPNTIMLLTKLCYNLIILIQYNLAIRINVIRIYSL